MLRVVHFEWNSAEQHDIVGLLVVLSVESRYGILHYRWTSALHLEIEAQNMPLSTVDLQQRLARSHTSCSSQLGVQNNTTT